MKRDRPLRIVIPGGSGAIGLLLARHFHANGHDVTVISRRQAPTPWKVVLWNGREPGPWVECIDGADVVINLAGRSVNCRYHDANRREIRDSRVRTTKLIGEVMGSVANPPRLWMNASTATIYRHTFDQPMDEEHGEIGGNEPDAPRAWRFSIEVATSWEHVFFEAKTTRTRKIALRSAIAMIPGNSGVFSILLRLVRARLGGMAGTGDQYVSWVHHVDFARAIDFLIEHDEIEGVVNIAAPNPVRNRDFMRILREAWGVRFGLPAARWMLEVAAFFHRTETELLLKSRRVVPGRLIKAGFAFRYPEWAEAARELVLSYR